MAVDECKATQHTHQSTLSGGCAAQKEHINQYTEHLAIRGKGEGSTVHTDGAMLGEAINHPPQSLVGKDILMSARGTDSSAENSNQKCAP